MTRSARADLEFAPDALALSVGIAPRADAEALAPMLKVPLNAEQFFLEAHMKLRPVEFATEGIYLAGMAHAPKFIEESIAQACAAVSRACTVLAKDELMSAGLSGPRRSAGLRGLRRLCHDLPVQGAHRWSTKRSRAAISRTAPR